jgi:hypothetical protein
MPPFELTYCKCNHPSQKTQVFAALENPKIGLCNLQNYIPHYHRFFLLSESNHNSIGLNHRRQVASIADVIGKNTVNVTLQPDSDDAPVLKMPAFIKHSPLLDPVKYLSGKYDMESSDLLVLPSFAQQPASDSTHQKKMHDPNNSSYVDAFFTYLSSQALHAHGFVHGLDFYGSYLATQNEFTVNVFDELEYFSTCKFFMTNKDVLFRIDDFPCDFSRSDSLRIKPSIKLDLDNDAEDVALELDVLQSSSDVFEDAPATDLTTADLADLTEVANVEGGPNAEEVEGVEGGPKIADDEEDSDSCSSRSSASSEFKPMHDHDNSGSDNSGSDDDNSGASGDSSSDASSDDDNSGSDDEVHNAHLFNFPVQAIVMEKCDNTLDSLMYGRNEMTEPEWAATLMQIIMTLIAYQHMFAFTHNDLHTNNVMFVKTEKKFLHYLYKGVYYRVPTHGRIMKIIDFGRAIYKYRGQTMVSDSFDRAGDAATQYNCEPYMNPKKPRLDPNPSFDLCRLACSLFDYFVDDIRDAAAYAETLKESRVARMVVEWLNDDKGRNVLYKKTGDERYPDFKLYKMIARTVHGAVPHEQLSKPMFAHYAIPRKQINGKPHIMDIDALPCYKDA